METKTTEIAEFREFEAKLAGFVDLYDGLTYDLDDPEKNKQARSDRRAIGSVIARLDEKHAEIKAPLKAQVDKIDGARKQIKDKLLGVQGKIKSQIEAHDQKKKDHEAKLEQMVADIAALTKFDGLEAVGSEELAQRLTNAKALEIGPEYEHKGHEAEELKAAAIEKLSQLHAETLRREADQAELRRLQAEQAAREQKERDDQIRREAEAKAKREAEEAAQAEIDKAKAEARQAEIDAERARQEAEEAAEAAKAEERAKIEEENRKRQRAEEDRQAEEAAKKRRVEHRAAIHGKAKAALMAEGFDEHTAARIVTLIKDDKIAHIKVEY